VYLVGEVETTFLEHVVDILGLKGLSNCQICSMKCLLLLVANRRGRDWLGGSLGIALVFVHELAAEVGGDQKQKASK